MISRPLMLALALACMSNVASANTPQQDRYNADMRQAGDRYASDRKICNDESNPGHRMQCLRAAKEENDKAMAAARAELQKANGGNLVQGGKSNCIECGRVIGVRMVEKEGKSNAVGLLAGGAAGALLGNQVGGGSGKTIATIAGAAGGAYAGKKIQEKATASKVWVVDMEYDTGKRQSFEFASDPGMKAGDRVRNNGQTIHRM
jgi:outer membrane lipoprotein SlyB